MIYAMRYHLFVDHDAPRRESGRHPVVEGVYVLDSPESKPFEYTWKDIEVFAKERDSWEGNVGFMCGGFLCIDSRVRHEEDEGLPFFVTLMKDSNEFEQRIEIPFIKEHDKEVFETKRLLWGMDYWSGIPRCTEDHRKAGFEWDSEDRDSFIEARGKMRTKLNNLFEKYRDYDLTMTA